MVKPRAPKTAHTPKKEREEMVVLPNFLISKRIVDALDAWVIEQNVKRRGPKLARTDLIRGLLDWAAETKPKWEE